MPTRSIRRDAIATMTIMSVLMGVIIIGTATAHGPSRPLTVDELAIGREVMDVRDQLRAAVAAKDVKAIVALFTEDFTHTDSAAKVANRDARIIALLTGEHAIELVPLDDLTIRVHGSTTVIVSGRSPLLNAAASRTIDVRWLQVFVRKAAGWQLAASQATQLPQP
jgi:ketosteroid isomerase-like protein